MTAADLTPAACRDRIVAYVTAAQRPVPAPLLIRWMRAHGWTDNMGRADLRALVADGQIVRHIKPHVRDAAGRADAGVAYGVSR